MSGSQNIRTYLLSFNGALQVGVRNRRRILHEIADHLTEAAAGETKAGANPVEAQHRVTAAFGSPEEVAAGFGSGVVGRLDRQLARGTGRADVWMAEHPWRGSILRMALFVPPALALLAGEAVLGPEGQVGHVSSAVFALAAAWSTSLGFRAWRLRTRPEPGLRARMWAENPDLLGHRIYQSPLGGRGVLGGFAGVQFGYLQSTGHGSPTFWCLFVLSHLLSIVIGYVLVELLLPPARTKEEEVAEKDDVWLVFRAVHPWIGALFHASFIPISAIMTALLVTPGSLVYKASLAAVGLGVTVGVALLRSSGWNRDEQDRIRREIQAHADALAPKLRPATLPLTRPYLSSRSVVNVQGGRSR